MTQKRLTQNVNGFGQPLTPFMEASKRSQVFGPFSALEIYDESKFKIALTV